jgi:methionine-S-sulfoxide reductase
MRCLVSQPQGAGVRKEVVMLRATGTIVISLALLLLASGAIGREEGKTMKNQPELATATFAGGCFWCMEPPFDKLAGVVATISGYTGGHQANPTYEEVTTGTTGHVEALQVLYDPAKTSYEQLLEVFWENINPTDADGQFVDRGPQYRSAIFYHDAEQQRLAEASKARLAASGHFRGAIVTPILAAGPFYPAEDYHQDYYQKNPLRYKYYRYNSGRDQFLEKVWGKDRK